ncbi:MAG: hypothetical protein HFE97_12790 [Oscillospiraceae bacterium]|nr:hypothetical protein [Oscillospiraceae bacterium]
MRARRITLPACLATLSLSLLYTASLAPSGRFCLIIAAGLVPAAAVVSAGLPTGFLCYGVTGVLGLLVLPRKEIPILYLLFFGLYPMVKSLIEGIGKLWMEWLFKLLFLNLVLILLLSSLKGLLMPFLSPILAERLWLAALMGNLFFPLYDVLFSRCITYYVIHVDRHLLQ